MATLYDCFGDEYAEGIKQVNFEELLSHIHTESTKASFDIQVEALEEPNSEEIMSTLEREDALERISKEVVELQKEYFKETGCNTTITDKCRHFSPEAWKVVEKMRALAEKNRSIIESKRDELLAWPVPAAADPDLFYNGKHDKILFTRNKDWFTTMGFKKFETPYTFTDRWDKQEIKATFLVPTDLGPNDPVSVMWFFHGGGFCTGAADHIPWFSHASLLHAKRHKAIIIAPDYPLGPEGTYKDISACLHDFLLWYKHDLFLRTPAQPHSSWTQWLSRAANTARIDPLSTRIFIEGESAGGHAATTTLFLNASKRHAIALPIRVALLRYPMVAHYTRAFTENMAYMGYAICWDDAQAQQARLEDEMLLLEKYGLVPTRAKGYAPEKMAAAFLLSTMGRWKTMFQRVHGPDAYEAGGGRCPIAWPVSAVAEDTWDCIERAEACVEEVDHGVLPAIYIYHGANDTNCPVRDTEKLVEVLKSRYPTRYNDETLHLEIVKYLSGKEKPEGMKKAVTEVNHAFDYMILEEHEDWLRDMYAKVDAQWTA